MQNLLGVVLGVLRLYVLRFLGLLRQDFMLRLDTSVESFGKLWR